MKKLVKLILEVESDNKNAIKDNVIIDDLKSEISCCSNWYEFISFEIKEVSEEKEKPKLSERKR